MRAITMALLLLGVVLNPVLADAGAIHELGQAGSHAATDHHHQVETASADSDDAGDQKGDAWHGLMHAGCAHGATTAEFFIPMVAVMSLDHTVVFPPTAPLTPRQHISGPFRPPSV